MLCFLRKFGCWIVLSVCLGVVAGCGGTKTVDVSGVVTLDGKPLAGVELDFISKELSSHGKTDAKGRFTLENGAEPGKNSVVFSAYATPKGVKASDDPEEGMDAGQLEAMDPGAVPGMSKGTKIPGKYTDAKTTITVNVPADGASDLKLELKSK